MLNDVTMRDYQYRTPEWSLVSTANEGSGRLTNTFVVEGVDDGRAH